MISDVNALYYAHESSHVFFGKMSFLMGLCVVVVVANVDAYF